jgi:predicted GTPase
MAKEQIIAKVQTADAAKVAEVEANCKKYNPKATTIKCNSTIAVDKPELIKGKRAIVIEDGPTLTYGGMAYGAGYFAAKSSEVSAGVASGGLTGRMSRLSEVQA